MTRPSPTTISFAVPVGAVASHMRALGMSTARKHVIEAEPPRAKAAPPARKPRKPTLASVAKAASKAAIPVARYEVKPDGTVVVVTGKPESIEPENPWPLDEFRRKETKE